MSYGLPDEMLVEIVSHCGQPETVALAGVNRHWRTVAAGAPNFYQPLTHVVKADSTVAAVYVGLRSFGIQLQAAAPREHRLALRFAYSLYQLPAACLKKGTAGMIDFVHAHILVVLPKLLARAWKLELSIPREHAASVYGLMQGAAEQLKTLRLDFTEGLPAYTSGNEIFPKVPRGLLGGNAAGLKYLCIGAVNVIEGVPAFGLVTHLTLLYATTVELVEVVAHFAALQSLCVEQVTWDERSTHAQAPQVAELTVGVEPLSCLSEALWTFLSFGRASQVRIELGAVPEAMPWLPAFFETDHGIELQVASSLSYTAVGGASRSVSRRDGNAQRTLIVPRRAMPALIEILETLSMSITVYPTYKRL